MMYLTLVLMAYPGKALQGNHGVSRHPVEYIFRSYYLNAAGISLESALNQ